MSKIITDKTNIVAIADAVRSKTGSTEELSLGEIISEIEGISGGGTTLPTLSSPASEEEVFLNKEFIDQNGAKKTGSFTLESEMSEQDSLISQIQTALEGKMSGGSGGNQFPYKVTIVSAGDLTSMSPILCYGDDGDSLVVLTNVGLGPTITSENCTCVQWNRDAGKFGIYAFFNHFTGDATITFTWTNSGSGQ